MTKKHAVFLLTLSFAGMNLLFISVASLWPQLWAEFSQVMHLSQQKETSREGTGTASVKRVIDGDTIEMENGDKVRYIGINTPESVDPRKKVECFGKEAAAFNRKLVEGRSVRLERDVSDHDRYGRLLRFVYLEDGTLVNEMLVREGYASVATYPPDVAKKDLFIAAEQEARIEQRGLWNEKTCGGKK
jgi:micrococcal nuclease